MAWQPTGLACHIRARVKLFHLLLFHLCIFDWRALREILDCIFVLLLLVFPALPRLVERKKDCQV